jgi:hypothetical protein
MSGCWLRLTMVDFCCSNVAAETRKYQHIDSLYVKCEYLHRYLHQQLFIPYIILNVLTARSLG